ncbi:F-box protein SKIP23 [Carex littledalei]|uniref:F-box protein SKIP23 n=1 Tax=Carex littledalei TaxID=544730 RepID=A0A833RJS7_9POAL|nr:F-box protein SKIP23 [Carex littledalei]
MQQHPCVIARSKVDWSSFPSELLFLICQKLQHLADFIHFRSVCTSWRLSAPRSVAPAQLPWLINLRNPDYGACVYSLSSCKFYDVQIPQNVKKKQLVGPGQTYVLARDCTNNSLSLFNPISGEEHPLPPLPAHFRTFHPLLLGPNPHKDGIILLCSPCPFWGRFITFCQTNGEKWSMLEVERENYNFTGTISCAFYNGLYFVNSQRGAPTYIINADKGQVVSVIEPPPGFPWCDYIVESFGDILRVQVNNVSGLSFRIYRLDYGGQNARWIEMRSIGDRILFLGAYFKFCWTGFTLRSCDVKGSRGNCIYLRTLGICAKDLHSLDLCRYDIEDKRIEFLPCTLQHVDVWFVPGLH